jgi:hypothetical protein
MRMAAHDYAIANHNWNAIAQRWQEVLQITLDEV